MPCSTARREVSCNKGSQEGKGWAQLPPGKEGKENKCPAEGSLIVSEQNQKSTGSGLSNHQITEVT